MVSAEIHDKLGGLMLMTEAVSWNHHSFKNFSSLGIFTMVPGIPDYPPPSFQEATSGLSPSPSAISLAPATVNASTVSRTDHN